MNGIRRRNALNISGYAPYLLDGPFQLIHTFLNTNKVRFLPSKRARVDFLLLLSSAADRVEYPMATDSVRGQNICRVSHLVNSSALSDDFQYRPFQIGIETHCLTINVVMLSMLYRAGLGFAFFFLPPPPIPPPPSLCNSLFYH